MEGLHHVPADGPFVLVPNHRSYFDHILMMIVSAAVRTRPMWFLTKRETFEHTIGRIWTEAWYGIPVDRDTPSPDTLRTVQRILRGGDALCVYPEGTRNTGQDLLPFRHGAFRFALSAGVPVIPVGIYGAETVLPKGRRWFCREGRVSIAFGAPIEIDRTAGKKAAADAMAAGARSAILDLVGRAEEEAHRGPSLVAAEAAGEALERRITSALDDDGRLSAQDSRSLRLLGSLLSPMESNPHHIAAQRARLVGLRLLQLPLPARIAPALAVRRTVEAVLRTDPEHRDANYLLGRWHLNMPRALGARPDRAVLAFKRSAAASTSVNTRALTGLADAYMALGDHDQAFSTLTAIVASNPAPQGREIARIERARKRLTDAG
ncbi:1-acyl-sn-glycerol-3-phosphate acyltransferase [Clavibacter sp. Sh2088]|uniref:1-acyl-sn-glycerol-3-phosphate acyltransferase n=1 Tax=Clavibacter sp. Sh2088 TaxID=3397676 RepID=UPI0039E12BAE